MKINIKKIIKEEVAKVLKEVAAPAPVPLRKGVSKSITPVTTATSKVAPEKSTIALKNIGKGLKINSTTINQKLAEGGIVLNNPANFIGALNAIKNGTTLNTEQYAEVAIFFVKWLTANTATKNAASRKVSGTVTSPPATT